MTLMQGVTDMKITEERDMILRQGTKDNRDRSEQSYARPNNIGFRLHLSLWRGTA